MGRRSKKYYSKEDIQMDSRYIKICLTTLIISETEIKNHNDISSHTC